MEQFKQREIYPRIEARELQEHHPFYHWIDRVDNYDPHLFDWLNPWGEVPRYTLLPDLQFDPALGQTSAGKGGNKSGSRRSTTRPPATRRRKA